MLTGAAGQVDNIGSCFIESQPTNPSTFSSFESPGIKAICRVEGPLSCSKRYQDVQKLRLSFQMEWSPYITRSGLVFLHEKGKFMRLQKIQEKISQILMECIAPFVRIERYPKMEMKCSAYILDDPGLDWQDSRHMTRQIIFGGCLQSLIMAFCNALCERGIELYDMFIGMTVALLKDQKNWLIDPTPANLEEAHGYLFVVQGGHQTTTLSYIHYENLLPDQVEHGLNLAQKESTKRLATCKASLKAASPASHPPIIQ
jgi:ribonuclease PH